MSQSPTQAPPLTTATPKSASQRQLTAGPSGSRSRSRDRSKSRGTTTTRKTDDSGSGGGNAVKGYPMNGNSGPSHLHQPVNRNKQQQSQQLPPQTGRNQTTTTTANNNNPSLIADTYAIGKTLGRGSYGEVHAGRNVHTNQVVAIKLEPVAKQIGQLSAEYDIYKLLQGKSGFPAVYHFGQHQEQYVLVMQMLSRNLESIFELCRNRFSVKSVIFLALQLVRRFQVLHQCGIVYRDVKPENFMMASASNTVYMIDFGLSQPYTDRNTGRHVPYRHTNELIGTTRYMSINAHMGREQSRRDDLEALGYMLAYWLRGKLPWSGLHIADPQEHNREICRLKRTIPVEQLLEGYPEAFTDYLREVRSLEFEAEPRYERLRLGFKRCFHRAGLHDDGLYDWNMKQVKDAQHTPGAEDTAKLVGGLSKARGEHT